ncbi:MAG: UMP kinase [Spirochaetaceae bacterium]
MVTVISVGGSIISPGDVDTDFVDGLRTTLIPFIEAGRRFILVTGGGAPARAYQHAYRTVVAAASAEELDWIGIAATRLNGQLLRAVFRPECPDPVVTDPEGAVAFEGTVLIAAGWKPGFSTDYDAVVLAERFGADTVVNLSNVEQVYTADPRTDPKATPLESVRWAEFRRLVGNDWVPGSNLPFDPVATRRAAELGLRVIAAGGRDLENLSRLLSGRSFVGTTIGPQ